MIDLTAIGLDAARFALARLPAAVEAELARGLDKAGAIVEREERDQAPKAFSTLTNSIRMLRTGKLERYVAPGVDWARYVIGGTGPAAGHARYYPDADALVPYVQQRLQRDGWKRGKRGSKAAISADAELMDAVRRTAWGIYLHGTQPDPFVDRSAVKTESRVTEILERAVADGVTAALAAQ